MSKFPTRVSAARRNAEALLDQKRNRESSFKLEQEREHEALVQKTARLRELRLAKEAADREVVAAAPAATKRSKPRRSKQT
jgi:serine/threonine protein kinase HipA of HipAB toxin-antitoxin module